MKVDGIREVRWYAGIVLPVTIAAVAVVPWVALAPDLPHRAAAHFDWRGHPNGSLPLPVLAVVLAGLAVLAAATLAWWAWSRVPDGDNRLVAFLAAFNGVLFGVLSVCIAWANKDHTSWRDVRLEPGAVGGALGAAFGVAFSLVAITAVQDVAPDITYPTISLAADERAAWFGRASSRLFAMLGGIMVLTSTVLVLAGLYGAAVGVGIGGLAVLATSSLSVAVGDRGIVVRSGPLRWPSMHFSLEDVVSAGTIDFKPLRWGGWGYRGSLRLLRRAAWGLRAGPAIELELRNGRRFAVTVDHADDGAAVINGLLAHRPVF